MARVDFGFSEDGDLLLGAPKVNNEGELLYIYSDGTISIEPQRGDEEGRLLRDMTYAYDNTMFKQVILNRLKTDAPDWFHYPNMGGNLTDLIGEPNTKETGEKGTQCILDTLNYGGLFHQKDVTVRAVPISPEEIMFVITISGLDGEPYRYPLVFNLNHGLREV